MWEHSVSCVMMLCRNKEKGKVRGEGVLIRGEGVLIRGEGVLIREEGVLISGAISLCAW